MKLERVRVRRLPGIREPFTVDGFGPGLTVVLGPNAGGKSSLCRAVASLLWPGLADDDAASLTAEVEVGGTALTAEREGRDVRWYRDGVAATPPRVPDEHLARCFVIAFDELLAGSAADAALAARIRRAVAGGYDVAAVRGAVPFLVGARHARREADELGACTEARVRAEQAHAALRTREDRLPALERDRHEAADAVAEAARLDEALALVRARSRLAACHETLAAFPPHLDRLHGDEGEELRRLCAEAERHDDACRQALADAARAAGAGAEQRLPADGVPESVLASLRARVDALRALERERDGALVALAGARATLAAAEQNLAGGLSGVVPVLGPDALSRATSWLDRAAELAAFRRELRSELRLLDAPEAAPDADALRQAIRLLRDWLAAGDTAGTRLLRPALLALGLLAIAATLWLGVRESPLWGIGAVLASVATAVAWRGLPARSSGVGSETLRAGLARAGRAHDGDLTREIAARRLAELESELARAEAAVERLVRRTALLAREAELDGDVTRVDAERDRLISALGLDPSVSDLALVPLARQVTLAFEARTQVARLDGEVAARQEGLARDAAAVAAVLAGFGEPASGAAVALAAGVDALAVRERRRAAAAAEHRTASERATAAAGRRDDVRRRIDGLLRAAAAGDARELAERLRLLPAWRVACDALDDARRAVHESERRLGEHVARLGGLDEAAVERAAAGARARAARADDLVTEIATIRRDVEHARAGTRLTDAVAAECDARARLADRLDDAWLAAAGRVLLDDVEREHAAQARPAVLAAASSWFSRFTRHGWALEMAPDGDDFGARETGTGERRRLAELSSGTRMQLLLAVRLAFALDAERGEALPLFLDEALTTSDPARTEAAVQALRVLAEAGRQIVYLTSRPSDAAAFGAGQGGVALVDLASARRDGVAAREVVAPVPVVPAAPPAPAHHSPESYGTLLQVPRLDLRARIESMHLFYLLRDDLPLLHRLLLLGCERLGQLEAMLAEGASEAALGAADATRLRAWVAVARAAWSGWSIGRGPRVDRQALAAAGVSDQWLDVLATMADERGGDAAALLAAVAPGAHRDPRLQRLQRRVIERVREQLDAAGHLDPRPTLDDETIVVRAMAATGGALPASVVRARVLELLQVARTVG